MRDSITIQCSRTEICQHLWMLMFAADHLFFILGPVLFLQFKAAAPPTLLSKQIQLNPRLLLDLRPATIFQTLPPMNYEGWACAILYSASFVNSE